MRLSEVSEYMTQRVSENMKKTIVFDFDGVINSYKSGWQGIDVIPDPPIEGIKEEIDELRKDYFVIVQSARCREFSGVQAISNYLKEYGIEVDGITDQKEPAIAYIDDRAIRFDGQAKGLANTIKQFNPWSKRAECIYCQTVDEESERLKFFSESRNDNNTIMCCIKCINDKNYYLQIETLDESGEYCTDSHSIPIRHCPFCGRSLG